MILTTGVNCYIYALDGMMKIYTRWDQYKVVKIHDVIIVLVVDVNDTGGS